MPLEYTPVYNSTDQMNLTRLKNMIAEYDELLQIELAERLPGNREMQCAAFLDDKIRGELKETLAGFTRCIVPMYVEITGRLNGMNATLYGVNADADDIPF